MSSLGLDVTELGPATALHGPARLPLGPEESHGRALLWYVEFGAQRYAVAVAGDPRRDNNTLLRLESACLFGHVFGSTQCDCGWQWRSSLDQILRRGSGVLIYAIDQDARGLGIAAHFDIYGMRQQEHLDTEAVFERLQSRWDARDYTPIPFLLRALGVHTVLLLSNNHQRLAMLKEAGFEVQSVALEAELTVDNMSTLMLEKEDLGYSWSFRTHADYLGPLQALVADRPESTAAALAVPGGAQSDSVVAGWDEICAAIGRRATGREPAENSVLYLTDLPRAGDLPTYAAWGVRVVAVPFPTLPDLLVETAQTHGIRLVDWSRQNAYSSPRAQWVPVFLGRFRHTYQRKLDELHRLPDASAPTRIYELIGSSWLHLAEEQP